MTERIVSNSAYFFSSNEMLFWLGKDEQTEILILDLLA